MCLSPVVILTSTITDFSRVSLSTFSVIVIALSSLKASKTFSAVLVSTATFMFSSVPICSTIEFNVSLLIETFPEVVSTSIDRLLFSAIFCAALTGISSVILVASFVQPMKLR